ncbi:uncharacterized protein LOC126669455 [Mercurialis annua]|uniref:uncharacterized protein LOC126669455 n=1 Tax=Mercurialis annua TaxID=3986 RepID=UPI00215EF677|nr:uncharacterized protein LOC126669455 [Mercurialis annua]
MRGIINKYLVSFDNSRCSLCDVVESQEHLFIHCVFARGLWIDVLKRLEITWVFPNCFEDFMIQWLNVIPRGPYWNLWEILWCLMVWEIWKSRNRRVFQNEAMVTEKQRDIGQSNDVNLCFLEVANDRRI